MTTPLDPELAAAFVTALGQVGTIVRDREAKVETTKGPGYKYSYADLASVLEHVRPILAANGLGVVQAVDSPDDHHIRVFTTIIHMSGATMDFGPLVFAAGSTPQQAGSAVTYMRRYSLMAALSIATEDDDGQAAQGNREASKRESFDDAKPRTPPPPPDPPVDPTPPVSNEAAELFRSLPGLPDATKAALKEVGAAEGKKLTGPSFTADPGWMAQVQGIIALHAAPSAAPEGWDPEPTEAEMAANVINAVEKKDTAEKKDKPSISSSGVQAGRDKPKYDQHYQTRGDPVYGDMPQDAPDPGLFPPLD